MKTEELDQLGPPGTHDYKGKFNDFQTMGNHFKGKRYVEIEFTEFNNYQNFLYNRALFGLAVYSQEEIKQMHWDKRKRIIKVHKRAQQVINIWKQEIVNTLSNHLFTTVFPKSSFTKILLETFGDSTDPEYINKMSFKSLHITKTQVVEKLIEKGILPEDFNTLTPKETCK